MDEQAPKSLNIRTLLITGLVLTLLNSLILFTIIGKGIYDDVKGKGKEGKIVLANVDPKDAEEITKQLVYQATNGKNTEYYSPALDALMKYDSGQYNVSESGNYVSFFEKGLFSFDRYAYVKLSSSTVKPSDKRQVELEGLYDDVKREEDGTVEDLAFTKFSYVKTSFTNKQEKSIINQIIIYRPVGNDYLVAEITYPNKDNVTEFSSDMARVLNSVELHPKNIASDIKVAIPNGGVEVTYNKSEWLVDSKSESSAYLSFRSSEKETNDKFKYTVTSVSINTNPVYGTKTLAENHKTYREFDEDFYKEKKFKLVKDSANTKINSQSFVVSEYTYEFAGAAYKTQLYTGLSLDNKHQINIKTLTPDGGSLGEAAIKTLIDAVQLVKTETEEIQSSLPLQENGVVMGTSSLEIDKSAIIGKPAVVHIFNRTCVEISVTSSGNFKYSGGKKYTECSAGLGTGFYISSEGYVITNGHVASPDPIDIVVQALYDTSSVSPFWRDMVYDILAALQAQGYSVSSLPSDQLIGVMFGAFINLYDQKAITLTAKSENFIEKEVTFAIDRATLSLQSPAEYLKTETVESHVDSLARATYNELAGKPSQINQPDIALLKVEGADKNTPVLSLLDAELLSVGLPINVIGFPGAANSSLLFASEASAIATITKGSISAIKPSANQTFKLIQIDASISHGNSGGPILNSDGEVVGIATYKINTTDTAEFNAGVSVEEVAKIVDKNNVPIKSNNVTSYINSGVNNLQKEYYKLALSDFEKAKDIYPKSAEVLDPLINISKDKISNGEDKTPIFNTHAIESKLNELGINVKGNTVVILVVAAAGLVLSLVLSAVVLIVKVRKNKGQKPPVFGNPVLPTDSDSNKVAKDTPSLPSEVTGAQPGTTIEPAFAPSTQPIETQPTPVAMPNVQPIPQQVETFKPRVEPLIPTEKPEPVQPVQQTAVAPSPVTPQPTQVAAPETTPSTSAPTQPPAFPGV